MLLDTHVWIWWLTGQESLARADRDALDALAEKEVPSISAISLWEAQMLHARGRLALESAFEPWLTQAAAPDVVSIVPLSVSVILALNDLPTSFRLDPADRIIAATSRAHEIPLFTYDRDMRRSRAVSLWKR
ncbi:MAG TPA: type II toxin-antitoxin system VapC family toxin [Thermoanaerobaculia bacterium]|nr:type II toxin-antitoxin system VapC family toxin [Thermoanaerobaculia bacterium]